MTKDMPPKERLVQGYEKMLSRVKDEIDQFQHKAGPVVHDHIDQAKQKAVELEELSEEEAQKIAVYLQRDLHDAASFLSDAKRVIGDWLYFDAQVAEDKLWHMFSDVADKTSLEIFEFKQRLRMDTETRENYRAGDVTSMGTLKCKSCGHLQHFDTVSHIPPCPKCQEGLFKRQVSDPSST